jgi:hypothetical protein
MKRFVETTRWRDPWFRRLSPLAKLLYCYLTDNCDPAGFIDLDLEAAEFDVGARIEEKHILELADRVQRTEDGKLFLPRFIVFQYGVPSETCPAHRTVLKLVKEKKLTHTGKTFSYPSATLPLVQAKGSVRVPLPYGYGTRKEKEKCARTHAREGSPSLVPTAEDIYSAYPRKTDKPAALRAINKALRRHGAAYLLERTIAYAKTQVPITRFTPHPATWFNGCRFDDDPKEWALEQTHENGVTAKPKTQAELNYEKDMAEFRAKNEHTNQGRKDR